MTFKFIKMPGKHGGKRPGARAESPELISKAKRELADIAKQYGPRPCSRSSPYHRASGESESAKVPQSRQPKPSSTEATEGQFRPSSTTGAAGGDIKHDIRIVIVDPKAR